LKIYGVDVIYIPRKFVRKQTIIREIQSSKFDDNYAIEAYINNYDGYSGQGDILSKFGVNLKDELSLVISKERFEDFISPFLEASDNDEIVLASRPREGDLVYFPLGQRLFEVKFVEHEVNFYQLGKLYMYELKCELFEYEDEVIDTTIEEIDSQIKDEGYITTLQLIGAGSTAAASAILSTGYVREIFLNNDGYNYTSNPTVAITTAPSGGVTASAVAITTTRAGVKSIESIILTNAGAGYTIAPNITIIGGGGTGAAATCSIETNLSGISSFVVNNGGSGYVIAPSVSFSGVSTVSAAATAIINDSGQVTQIRITNSGLGYTVAPTITIGAPSIYVGFGTYVYNEVVVGSASSSKARVKSWNATTKVLEVSNISGIFSPGETLIGQTSSAQYSIRKAYTDNLGPKGNLDDAYSGGDTQDRFADNKQIEIEGDAILDFSEENPFGIP
jgi:hypothetical protein